MTDPSSDEPAETDAATFEDTLDRVKGAYEAAETGGRFEPLADYCAEDLVVLRPDHEPIAGRGTWAAMFDEALADNPEIDATWTSQDTVVGETLAIDRGICDETVVGADGEPIDLRFNYLWVFGRVGETWEITHKIWNRIR